MKSIIITVMVAASMINSAHSCSTWEWIKCGATVIRCAAACAEPTDPVCITCFGSLYEECKSCIGFGEEVNALVTYQGAQAQTCDAWDWIQCSSGLYNCEVVCEADLTAASCSSCLGDSYSNCVYCIPSSTAPNLTQSDLAQLSSCSSWDWLKCAGKVADCASTCRSNGITSSQCISCFGSFYDKCRHCVTFDTAVQSRNSMIPEDCSTGAWVQCAGPLAQCSEVCIEAGFNSPQCFLCLGPNSYEQCTKCISSTEVDDMFQLALAQDGSCTDYCQSVNGGNGVVIGTAPFCGASCSDDCSGRLCTTWPANCFSGHKVCCCARGPSLQTDGGDTPKQTSVGLWIALVISLGVSMKSML